MVPYVRESEGVHRIVTVICLFCFIRITKPCRPQDIPYDIVIVRKMLQFQVIFNPVAKERVVARRTEVTVVFVVINCVTFRQVKHVVGRVIKANIPKTRIGINHIVITNDVAGVTPRRITKLDWRCPAFVANVVLHQIPATVSVKVDTFMVRP